MVDRQFLDALRGNVQISDLVGARVALKKNGNEFNGLCPFHGEKTPSFTVNDKKQFYHCFGCGAHGDAISWMQEMHGYSFIESIKQLAQMANMPMPDNHNGEYRTAQNQSAHQPQNQPQNEPEQRPSYRRNDASDDMVSSEAMGGVILSRCRSGDGGAVATYLTARGVRRDVIAALNYDEILFCPHTPVAKWKLQYGADGIKTAPAMICKLRRPDPSKPMRDWPITGIHITYLADDYKGKRVAHNRAGKIMPSRKMLGTVQGSCVVLGQYDAAAALVVGEGIESTLSGQPLAFDACAIKGCAIAALSLNNLQGYSMKDRRGALPMWHLRPDMNRDALFFAHDGPLILLVDADMKPSPIWYDREGQPKGPKIAETSRGPYVIRAISMEERAEICARQAAAGWTAKGVRDVQVLRPKMGMDFNDMAMAALRGAQ